MSEALRTLVVGNGGREHAMMAAFDQPEITMFSTRGNVGMQALGESIDVAPTDIEQVVASTYRHGITTLVVGPESPLIKGMADESREVGIPTVGFGLYGAHLEGSKIFGWEFAKQSGLLVPSGLAADNFNQAKFYAESMPAETLVLKADGEAGGKGVSLHETTGDLIAKLEKLMIDGEYDGAGKKVLFQERLHGPEASLFALFDGTRAYVFDFAQDHKRLYDGDEGPNTGGMGAYSPVPETIVSDEQRQLMYEALEKTIEGTERSMINSPGIFYMGFMLAEEYGNRPVLMEYNVRFGDPEAQVVLSQAKDAGVNVHELFFEAARGGFTGDKINFLRGEAGRAALTVCLAANGYPDSVNKNAHPVIHGLDREYDDVFVHHGGTKYDDEGQIVVNGGRVLYVTGKGSDLHSAARAAYAAIGENGIHFDGNQYRQEIGRQALAA